MLTIMISRLRKGMPYVIIATGYAAAAFLIHIAPPNIYGSGIYMAGAAIHMLAAVGSIGRFKWALGLYLVAAIVVEFFEICFFSNHISWLIYAIAFACGLGARSGEYLVSIIGLLIALSMLIKILIWQKVCAEFTATFEKQNGARALDV